MVIWYKCNRKDKQYFKFIIFNTGKVKMVNNSNMKRRSQYIQSFKNGENFLDAIQNLFELQFIEISELAMWILENY